MSFYASSEDIRTIEEGGRTWLVGRARKADGSYQDIKLDLDNIIGNRDGKLCPLKYLYLLSPSEANSKPVLKDT